MTPRVWVAGPHEAETVAALLVEFRDHLGYDWPSANAFHAGVDRIIDEPQSDFLLGAPHDDAPPAGVCQLRFRWGVWRAGTDGLLEDLYVREAARGSGLGRALVDFAVTRTRERGGRRMELDVRTDNAAARALYESCGFVNAGELYYRLHLDPAEDGA